MGLMACHALTDKGQVGLGYAAFVDEFTVADDMDAIAPPHQLI
ncbi:MAG: hypothetical protein AAGN15_07980 [Cyanobacteria bacterium J06581_3]